VQENGFKYETNVIKIGLRLKTLKLVSEDGIAQNLFKSGKLDYVRPVNYLELGELKDKSTFH
jgi:hypothetical protein